MAKREVKVSEDKLQKLVKNEHKSVSELAEMLGAGESTINYWVAKLKKSMKANGMSDEQIKETDCQPKERYKAMSMISS